MTFSVGQPSPVGFSFECKNCKVPPICIATCGTRIYYVFGTANITHACIHLGLREYLVKVGKNQESKERTHTLIGE
jgi:uncharacterized protein (UPF0179 family)